MYPKISIKGNGTGIGYLVIKNKNKVYLNSIQQYEIVDIEENEEIIGVLQG